MKKYIFIFLSLFLVLLIPKNVYATTYTGVFANKVTKVEYSKVNASGGFDWYSNSTTMQTIGSLNGWRSTYTFSGSSDYLPHSHLWSFDNYSYTKGTNWELKFNIHASDTSMQINTMIPRVTAYTDYGEEICGVKYGGYYFLSITCAGSSTNNLKISLYDLTIPVIYDGFYFLANTDSSIKTDIDNSYLLQIQNQNTQQMIQNQNQNTQQIINNNNLNTQNIINNNTQNAQAIIGQITDSTPQTETESSTTLDKWKNLIPTNGVVSSLFLIPVNLLDKLVAGFNGTCQTFNLGNLMGTDLILPCIQPANFFGSTLWGVIDLACCGMMLFSMFKKFVKVFSDITNLRDTPMNELYGGGR